MTKDPVLNDLNALRRDVLALSDDLTASYLASALACFARGNACAGEQWLELGIERLEV